MTSRHIAFKESTAILMFGGLVGAGVALMTTPWSGQKMRRKIYDFTDDIKGKAECYTDIAKQRVTHLTEQSKELVEEKRSAFRAALQAGRNAYEKEVARLHKKEGRKSGHKS